METNLQIVIIGSGNVAWQLAKALKEKGNPPVQIYARNEAAGREIAEQSGSSFASSPQWLAVADLYILAVSDKAIPLLAASLDFGDAVVAHTAGSVPMEALGAKVANKAVIYPLQTFTKGREVDMSVIPLLIEGSNTKSIGAAEAVAGLLSTDVRAVSSAHRAMIHVAAVFASNFTNYMYCVGEQLAQEAGADFSILKPLIVETAAKAASAHSPVTTQTGPAVRNDFQTKSLHCEMLVEKPGLKNIYINLSNNIWETSKKTSQK